MMSTISISLLCKQDNYNSIPSELLHKNMKTRSEELTNKHMSVQLTSTFLTTTKEMLER